MIIESALDNRDSFRVLFSFLSDIYSQSILLVFNDFLEALDLFFDLLLVEHELSPFKVAA